MQKHFVAAWVMMVVVCGLVRGEEPRPVPAVQRALIVSVDGMRPDMLLRCNTPVMHELMKSGSFTFYAQTTDVAITLPSHTSMVTGVTPERHGVNWNKEREGEPVYPKVPTLFELAKKAGLTTAMAAGKEKFATLAKPGTLDWVYLPGKSAGTDADVAKAAVAIIMEHRPQVMFVHFPNVDGVGHGKGWGSPQQEQAVEKADECLGLVLAAYREQKLLDSTVVILSADHGGAGKTHGGLDMRSRAIPWIIVGPGIRKNFDLTQIADLQVHTEDTFATTCALMGVSVPYKVDGKPIGQILLTVGEPVERR